jgi:xyloglucan 6-xylosyltransferase
MVAHPEKKLLWWVDSDVVFTEMLFEPPWGTYARHNLLIHSWDEAVYDTKNWLDRHQRRQLRHQELPVALNLLDGCAKMGPCGPVGEKYGRIFAKALSNRAAYEADEQCESFFS